MEGGSPNKKIRGRAGWLCIVLSVLFLILSLRIFIYQTFQYDTFRQKVIDQITQETTVKADRGNIYDANGIVIATNVTTYRLFLDPAAIERKSFEDGKNYADLIAKGVAAVEEIGVSYEAVMTEAAKTKYRDRTLARHISEAQADEIRAFMLESEIDDLALLHLEATSKRYYPYKELACHVLGFTGGDGEGLYGLEYQYDEILSGTDGKYIGAKDSFGNELVYDYESYIPAIDGYNITTTIDVYIQAELEEQLKTTYIESGGKNRACGIVMDTETGAILAMAVYPNYDLNNPRELNYQLQEVLAAGCQEIKESGVREGTDEYASLALDIYCRKTQQNPKTVKEKLDTYEKFESLLSQTLMMSAWSNKAINEMYYPGSTFKVITAAMAYEENLVDDNDNHFVNCTGSKKILDRNIHCHDHKGHGYVSFARGLQQSCNPALMTIGAKIGAAKYLDYFSAFGYFEKSGIDISGESVTTKGSTFWTDADFLSPYNSTDENGIYREERNLNLAVASFGQNFKISPIAHITAINAVANDGNLVTPHFIKEITDNEGNVIYSYETEVRRQVISAETSFKVSSVLEEGVSGDGGSRNAYVDGYRIAAKTGTSEKKDTNSEYTDTPYVCSAVAYAPYDAPKLTAMILVDEPTEGVLYASTIAAPYIANLMEEILPYYGINPEYSGESKPLTSPALVWGTPDKSKTYAESLGFKVEIIGSGDKITAQSPAVYTEVDKENAVLYLYAPGQGETVEKKMVYVPDLTGRTLIEARSMLAERGLNVKIVGNKNDLNKTGVVVYSQSVDSGTLIEAGSVVELIFENPSDFDKTDYVDIEKQNN